MGIIPIPPNAVLRSRVMQHRSPTHCRTISPSRRWPGHRSTVSAVVQAHGRRLCRLGNGRGESAALAAPTNRAAAPITRARSTPIAVQIAGADPAMMAEAARYNVDQRRADHRHQHGLPGEEGLQRCRRFRAARERAAGRARSSTPSCAPSTVPVTLKIRTGPGPAHRNALTIARIAEDAGIAALAVHGRTRACLFVGRVEYDTDRAPSSAPCAFPCSPTATSQRRRRRATCSSYTGADALMIGRAAQGRPWIFREIAHYLDTGTHLRRRRGRRGTRG